MPVCRIGVPKLLLTEHIWKMGIHHDEDKIISSTKGRTILICLVSLASVSLVQRI